MRRAQTTIACVLVGIGIVGIGITSARADDHVVDGDAAPTAAAANAAASGDDDAATQVAAADDAAAGSAASEPPPAGAAAGNAGHPSDKGAIGIGLIIGEPTGISARLYVADDKAIQVAVGSAFIGGGLQVNGDFVWHPWILQDRASFVLPVYLGPGVRFIDYYGARGGSSHFAAGARAVIGMLFDFKDVPLDVFVEVAGVGEYDFTKGWGAALNAGAGVRYYF